jgi:hypothetical protein
LWSVEVRTTSGGLVIDSSDKFLVHLFGVG